MTDNFSFLFQYLKKEKITIDQNEFIFQLNSHPESPSLLAISDTLTFFNIINLATKINFEDIIHLPKNFVAIIKSDSNQFLAAIEKEGTGFKYQEDKKLIRVSENEFKNIFQNIVLLAEKEEGELITKKTNNLVMFALIFIGITYLFSIFTNDSSLLTILFIGFTGIGVYLSLEAISHEFGIQTKFSDAVCTISKNSDCDAVINAKKLKLLENFSFSEASITLFLAQILGLLLFTVSNKLSDFFSLTTIILLFSIPITFFSFYQQIVVAKKWCPICLAIISIIYVEIGTLFTFTNFIFVINTITVAYFILIFLGSYIATVFVKSMIKQNLDFKSKIIENNRFKRKYSLFKKALLSNDKVNEKISNSKNIFLGNPEAKLKIRIVSSPFCGHCKEVHEIIEEILNLHKDKVCFDLHFNFDISKSNEKSKKTHHKLVQIYLYEGQNIFMKALHNWFENKDESKLMSIETSQVNDLKINKILFEQFSWNYENSINYTPAIIINNHLFPKEYDRNELIYFINDLEDDTDFS